MKKTPQQAPPKRRPFNAFLDDGLITTLQAYCIVNKRAGSPSDVINHELAKLLKSKARRYGLKIPAHL